MTSIEEHKNIVNELINDIDEKIRAGLLVKRQKIVGFAASEISTNLFALLLHKKSLISAGFNVNHRFFASSKKAKETFKENFEKKDLILDLLIRQESFRDKLCYGKEKDEIVVHEAIKNLFALKQIIEKTLGEELLNTLMFLPILTILYLCLWEKKS